VCVCVCIYTYVCHHCVCVCVCVRRMTYTSFVTLFVAWFLFALHLPLGVLLGDVCAFIDTEEVDLQEGTTDIQVTLSACLTNVSLTEAFNVSAQLEFADAIVIPTLPPINQTFDFGQLNTFENRVSCVLVICLQFP